MSNNNRHRVHINRPHFELLTKLGASLRITSPAQILHRALRVYWALHQATVDGYEIVLRKGPEEVTIDPISDANRDSSAAESVKTDQVD